MSVNDLLGVSQEELNKATGEVAKPFEPLPAGCYKATIKEILVYKNNFESTSMRYTVNITSEDRDVEFMKDIGSTLKNGETNGGYTNRIKQFAYAANVPDSEWTPGDKVKINSFGKEYEATKILGPIGKPVIAEVLLMDDTNKADGVAYKLQNKLSGVLAMDGTDSSGENKADEFAKRCEEKPLTPYEGYVKPGNAATKGTVGTDAAKEAASSAGF